jgi:L-ascorbate metabolism protein UlaG (beta-lactamase superfamily)
MKDIHLNPEEAVRAHRDLNSEQSLGIHFGVFQLTWETIDQPLIDLEDALHQQKVPQTAFWVLEPGAWKTVMPSDQ